MNKAEEDIRMSKHVLQIKVCCHLSKNSSKAIYISVNLNEHVTGNSCNKLHKEVIILFARYLQQVAGTSYKKLQENVVSCYRNLQVTNSYKFLAGSLYKLQKKLLYS